MPNKSKVRHKFENEGQLRKLESETKISFSAKMISISSVHWNKKPLEPFIRTIVILDLRRKKEKYPIENQNRNDLVKL